MHLVGFTIEAQSVLSIIMRGVTARNEPWPPFISNPYTWIYGNRSSISAFKKSESSLSTEWFPHLLLAHRFNTQHNMSRA